MNRWSPRQMTVASIVLAAALLIGSGAAVWYWWPREVAPGLTPQMVRVLDTQDRQVTLVDGGSHRDAHTLWSRYHGRAPSGTPPTAPRLLGISLAKVDADSFPGSGTYWVVYSDHVWSVPLGGPGKSAFAQEVTFVDPSTLRAVGTETL